MRLPPLLCPGCGTCVYPVLDRFWCLRCGWLDEPQFAPDDWIDFQWDGPLAVLLSYEAVGLGLSHRAAAIDARSQESA